jgi:hypothetical protein
MNLTTTIAAKLGFVPLDVVEGLAGSYETLLELTAKSAWSEGAESSASAIHKALQDEGEHVAAEAPRGVLHHHPRFDGVERDDVERAAYEVEHALYAAGVRRYADPLQRDRIDGHVKPLVQTAAMTPTSTYESMINATRGFVAQRKP